MHFCEIQKNAYILKQNKKEQALKSVATCGDKHQRDGEEESDMTKDQLRWLCVFDTVISEHKCSNVA